MFYHTCVRMMEAADIKIIIKKRHLPWAANYIVVKRAMAKTKFRVLRSSLLNDLNSDLLNTLRRLKVTKIIFLQ